MTSKGNATRDRLDSSSSNASSSSSSERRARSSYKQIRKQSSPAQLSAGYPSTPYSTPSPVRNGHKRSQSVKYPSGHRRPHPGSTRLTVPTTLDLETLRTGGFNLNSSGDEESRGQRVRNFQVTPKGIVNRGDSYRTRSITSLNTPIGPNGEYMRNDRRSISSAYSTAETSVSDVSSLPSPRYKVLMSGAADVGKTALTKQFFTSEYMNAYDEDDTPTSEKSVTVLLDGQEAELYFIDPDTATGVTFYDERETETGTVDAHVIVYNVVDRTSFERAVDILFELKQADATKHQAIILVGNKSDLVRARIVSVEGAYFCLYYYKTIIRDIFLLAEGRSVASSYDCKFIETSAGLNHNVDELLVGILAQIRLKEKLSTRKKFKKSLFRVTKGRPYKKRSLTSGYEKAFGMLARLLQKNTLSKSCGNLHVL